jgi:uncharacterized protein DUF2154
MARKKDLIVICTVVLVVLSCTTIRLPKVRKVETGPTQTKQIKVPLPDGGDVQDVEIAMGAGQLVIQPGAETSLIEGEIRYNVQELAPEVTTSGDGTSIRQGKLEGIPDLENTIENHWDLRLGQSPMALTLNVGAAEADVDLGGLALHRVTVAQGASNFDLSFSEANPAEMNTFGITAGASRMVVSGLGNANAAEVAFKGGAGSYTFQFDGELQRDVRVSIDAGLGQVVVIVPEGVPATVVFEGAAADVDAVQEWARTDEGFAMSGTGFGIAFEIKMGAGGLELRNK